MSAAGQRSASQAEEARKQHRDTWFIALVAGFAVIFFGNLFGIGAWWLATVAAGVMIGFAYAIKDTEVSGDAKGDSIYYLGFLFTFAALVAALISFDQGTSVTGGGATSGGIRNFGIALLTTIFGLAGRVWFAMSQESPGDVADTATLALEEAVSEMKRSLDRARDDLDTMANKFRESAIEMGKTTADIATSAAGAARTASSLDEYAGRVAEIAGSHTRSFGDFFRFVDAGSHAADGFGKSLRSLQNHVSRLHDHIKDLGPQLNLAFSAMGEEAGATAQAMPRLRKGVENAASRTASLDNTLANLQAGASGAATAFERLVQNLDGAELEPVLKEAARHASTMRAELHSLGQAAAKTRGDLTGLSLDGLKHQVLALEQDIAETRRERVAENDSQDPFAPWRSENAFARYSGRMRRAARRAIDLARRRFRRRN